MQLSALATTVIGFTAVVAVGAILRRSGLVERRGAQALNAVIIYVGLPAFVFRAVQQAPLGTGLLGVVAVAWSVMLVVGLLAWVAARALRLEPKLVGAFVLAAALGNTGYIGYPVTEALLGRDAVPAAVFYDVFGTVVALLAIGIPLAHRMGTRRDERVAFEPMKDLVALPGIVALLLALGLRGVDIPVPVMDWLGMLGNMVAPLVMLSVGISLRFTVFKPLAVPLSLVALFRLVIAPAIGLFVAGVLVSQGEARQVAVLESSVPTMMLTVAVADRFGLDHDFAAGAVFVTTALSALTMSAVQLLVS